MSIASARAQAPAIRWLPDASPIAVEATHLTAENLRAFESAGPADVRWAELLAVYAEQGGGGAIPPMAGTWHRTEGRLLFRPRFPLARGVRYRAELRVPGAKPLLAFFELPADTARPTTEVSRIFPSGGVLPENQLKFYVQFSAPMDRGGAYQHIHVRDATGAKIELAFLELDEELWDLSMTRLTLLIDPGRIKRGVKPLVDVGPVFEAGKRYAITVEAAYRDAAGRPLRAAFSQHFLVGPADRTPPDPARWTIKPPAGGTRDALVVRFDEPMDRALALRLIGVMPPVGPDADEGAALDGESTLENEEREWKFVPAQAWRAGAHHLTVATTIEDLAGNNIGKPFDVDVFENVSRRIETPTVSVGFEVK